MHENLKTYINFVTETAQYFMDNSQFKPANRILKQCETALTEQIPHRYAYQYGHLFLIRNNLAQLANKLGDVNLSVQYLQQACESCQDPRIQNKDELPLAETYLNLANAHAFLNDYKRACEYADKATTQAQQHC